MADLPLPPFGVGALCSLRFIFSGRGDAFSPPVRVGSNKPAMVFSLSTGLICARGGVRGLNQLRSDKWHPHRKRQLEKE
jgi:hypothetical protein